MKVIFLDIDGVMNDEDTIMKIIHEHPEVHNEDDPSIEHLNVLKEIVDATGADIVLSSAWRIGLNPTARVMDALAKVGLYLRSVTPDGVPADVIRKKGFKPSERYMQKSWITDGPATEITTDRGAEICYWLSKHPEYDSFVIIDDEEFDIKQYYPGHLIKTDPRKGLLKKHIAQAIKILQKGAEVND